MQAIQQFKMPNQFNINVRVTFEGKTLSSKLYDENPDIQRQLISKAEFNALYASVKAQTKAGMQSELLVSERGVEQRINFRSL